MSHLPSIPELVAAISTHDNPQSLAEHYKQHYKHGDTDIHIIANSDNQVILTLPYYETLNHASEPVTDNDMSAISGGTNDTSMPTPVFFSRFLKISRIIDAAMRDISTAVTDPVTDEDPPPNTS